MSATPSRYLTRLEAEIAKAGDTVDGDCLRAEKAAYLARQGRLEEARALVESVRGRSRTRSDFLVSSWLSLAEGLVAYFGDIGLGARDKFLRAQAFSSSAGLRRLESLCSAWLAQMDYSGLDPDSMMLNVRRAFAGASADHHSARGRASLVLAQALHYARRFDLAVRWYERARHHAIEDGDDAAISALMHNMAWLRMGSLRQSVLLGEPGTSEGRLALIGEESMRSFDALIGAASFKELDPLLRAETLSLEEKHSEALQLYIRHLGEVRMAGVSRWKSVFFADRAWCHAQVGQYELALTDADAADEALSPETQVDDRAATHSRLAQVFLSVGDADRSERHRAAAERAWRDVAILQAKFVELAGTFEAA